jgi:hypothetical protein
MVAIKIKGENIIFYNPDWSGDYVFCWRELENDDYNWFVHLAKKSWFKEHLFWELLGIVKNKFPDKNFDKQVWLVAKVFHERDIFEHKKVYKLLNTNG